MVEHGGHQAQVIDLLFPAINFGLFAFLLVRFMGGPIREYFRERTERLREGLAAGKRAAAEADTLRAQIDRDLGELPATQDRLKADLLATAAEARNALLAQGREAAERIRADATLVAEQETQSAQRAVRAEVVGEAIRQATQLVQGAVTNDDQIRFVHDFVETARPNT